MSRYRNSLRLHPVETDMYKAIFKLASQSYCDWEKLHILTGEGNENEFSKSVSAIYRPTDRRTDRWTGRQTVYLSDSWILKHIVNSSLSRS